METISKLFGGGGGAGGGGGTSGAGTGGVQSGSGGGGSGKEFGRSEAHTTFGADSYGGGDNVLFVALAVVAIAAVIGFTAIIKLAK